jgi:hypothetical protein
VNVTHKKKQIASGTASSIPEKSLQRKKEKRQKKVEEMKSKTRLAKARDESNAKSLREFIAREMRE